MFEQKLDCVFDSVEDLMYLVEDQFFEEGLGIQQKGCTVCSHTCSGGTTIEI